jgi:hypothetical protein
MIEVEQIERLINEMRNKYRKFDKELNSPFCNLPNRNIEIDKTIAIELLGLISELANQVPKLDSSIDTVGITREMGRILKILQQGSSQ